MTLRRYAGAAARIGEIARKVEEGVIPMPKGQPGFRGYCALASEDGDAVSLTIFEQREQATRANEQVLGWARANLRDLLPDPPEVFAGECSVAEVARGQEQHAGSGQPLYVLIRRLDNLALREKMQGWSRQNTMPVITGAPGFRGVYMLRDERDGTRAAVVTLFDTRENALRSHERAVQGRCPARC